MGGGNAVNKREEEISINEQSYEDSKPRDIDVAKIFLESLDNTHTELCVH